MKVTIKTNYDTIRIYIDSILYVLLKRKEFVGVQAWLEGGNKYCIEFTTKTTNILTEQDSSAKWKALLEAIDKQIYT